MRTSKYFLNLLLVSLATSTSFVTITKNTNVFDDGEIKISNYSLQDLTSKLLVYVEANENTYISNITKIYFDDSEGYFIEFESDGMKLNSITIKGDYTNFEVYSIYEPGVIPFKESERFCISPVEFALKPSELDSEQYSVNTNSDYSWGGVTYEQDTIDSTLFPAISNVNEKLYFYSSSYLNEVSIKNVPNYMNTQYNNNGCAPTAAAMYLAYLEDNVYNNICNNLNLPIRHTDDKSKVDMFIRHLGDNYFNTTNTGTSRTNISTGYDNYFFDHGLGNYRCEVSKSYFQFVESIYNCALPVPISIFPRHSVLGIGYKDIFNGTKTDKFIIANYIYNNKMSEVAFNVNELRQFYFIHK